MIDSKDLEPEPDSLDEILRPVGLRPFVDIFLTVIDPSKSDQEKKDIMREHPEKWSDTTIGTKLSACKRIIKEGKVKETFERILQSKVDAETRDKAGKLLDALYK